MLSATAPFLYALGWAIINSLWQTGLLWLVYKFIFSIHNRATAKEKNFFSTVFLFSAFIWFAASFSSKYMEVRNVTAFAVNEFSYLLLAKQSLLKNGLNGSAIGLLFESILPYLSVIYLFVLLLLSFRLLGSYRYTNKLRNQGLVKIDVDWKLYVQKMCGWIGIHKEVKIYLSELIDVPATIGYLKPVILLPVATFSQLSMKQVEAVILHELAHIGRSDYLLNIIVSVIETILFFNPFAKLLSKHIRSEREHSCDDFVLQFSYHPSVYAEALLTLEKSRIIHHHYAMAATGKENDLLLRVKRILNIPQQRKAGNNFHVLLLLLVSLGLFSLAWIEPLGATRISSNYTMKIPAENWRTMSENTPVKQLPDVVLLSRRNTVKTKEEMPKDFVTIMSEPGQPGAICTAPAPPKQLKNIAEQKKEITVNVKPAIAGPGTSYKFNLDIADEKALSALPGELSKKQRGPDKTIRAAKENMKSYFVWDYEVQEENAKNAGKRLEELRKINDLALQRMNRTREFQLKIEEFKKNFRIEPMEEMQKAFSGMHGYADNNFQYRVPAAPVYFEKVIAPGEICNNDEDNGTGKQQKIVIRVYNNGTMVLSADENGRQQSKLYKVERKAARGTKKEMTEVTTVIVTEN